MVRRLLPFLLSVLVLASAAPALADGGYFLRDLGAASSPEQRAIVLFEERGQTLLLQSALERSGEAREDTVGWVLPVPAVPDLATMDRADANRLFEDLARMTNPVDVSIRGWAFLLLCPAASIGSAAVLVLALQRLPFFRRYPWTARVLAVLLAGSLLCVPFPYMMAPDRLAGINVLKAEQVGIYDVQVITSPEASDLIAWLTDNGFRYDAEDTDVFAGYLERGWVIVVAKIDAAALQPAQDAPWRRPTTRWAFVDPLILRFESDVPVYPLALTSTMGQDTHVELYLYASGRWAVDERLALVYAGRKGQEQLDRLVEATAPAGFFASVPNVPYLCRFEGDLSPLQMREDLAFIPAMANRSYREYNVHW